MQIGDTLELVQNTLEAGMTTDVSEHEDYFVKTWKIVSHEQPSSEDFPMAVVSLIGSQIRPFAVGQDVEEVELQVTFLLEVGSVYSEDNKAIAVVERAAALLRNDPTLGQEVIDTRVKVRFPVMTSYGVNGNSLSKVEIRCKVRVAVPV